MNLLHLALTSLDSLEDFCKSLVGPFCHCINVAVAVLGQFIGYGDSKVLDCKVFSKCPRMLYEVWLVRPDTFAVKSRLYNSLLLHQGVVLTLMNC